MKSTSCDVIALKHVINISLIIYFSHLSLINFKMIHIKGLRESRKNYVFQEIMEKFEVNSNFCKQFQLQNRKNSGFVIAANHEPVSVMEVKKSFPQTLNSHQQTVETN